MPDNADDRTGTPSTGTVVLAASIPGRCAAPPAPAMIARRPRSAAPLGVLEQQVGGPVGRHDPHLVGDVELLEDVDRRTHGGPVRGGAHHHADAHVCPRSQLHGADCTALGAAGRRPWCPVENGSGLAGHGGRRDVAAVVHARPRDVADGVVGPLPRRRQVGALAGDVEHPAAGGDQRRRRHRRRPRRRRRVTPSTARAASRPSMTSPVRGVAG